MSEWQIQIETAWEVEAPFEIKGDLDFVLLKLAAIVDVGNVKRLVIERTPA